MDHAKAATVSEVKSYPKQIIRIMTSDCSIDDFDYQDPRVLTTHDLSDVETEVASNDAGASKMVALKRRYLGDASIDFRLKVTLGHEGSFRIANTMGSSTTYYYFVVKFTQSDTVDVAVLIRNGQIITIYQESPKLMTFFQYNGTI